MDCNESRLMMIQFHVLFLAVQNMSYMRVVLDAPSCLWVDCLGCRLWLPLYTRDTLSNNLPMKGIVVAIVVVQCAQRICVQVCTKRKTVIMTLRAERSSSSRRSLHTLLHRRHNVVLMCKQSLSKTPCGTRQHTLPTYCL